MPADQRRTARLALALPAVAVVLARPAVAVVLAVRCRVGCATGGGDP